MVIAARDSEIARQKEDEVAWQKMLAEHAGEVIPPGFMREGMIIASAPEETPQAVRVSSLRYKGYVQMWDTKTGALNLTPQWFRWQVTKMKHDDGTFMYTFTNPNIAPDYGQNLFCPLNPASPDYEKVKGMGFKSCKKAHIPHQDAVQAHLIHSHKRGFSALERVRQERIREEDRAIQLQVIKSNQEIMQGLLQRQVAIDAPAPPAPLYVSDKPKRARRSGRKPK